MSTLIFESKENFGVKELQNSRVPFTFSTDILKRTQNGIPTSFRITYMTIL